MKPSMESCSWISRIADFLDDLGTSQLASGWRWLVPAGGSVALGLLAPAVGWPAWVGIVAAAGLLLIILVAVVDRDRWSAQNVLLWQQQLRVESWIRDTGALGPAIGDEAHAEVWLGSHPSGSVPQLYRALVAAGAADEHVSDREIAALPEATPVEAAWKRWAIEQTRLERTGRADMEGLRIALRQLPDGRDREELAASLAVADAIGRHAAGERGWIEPLLEARAIARRPALHAWDVLRLWWARLALVPIFVVTALMVGSLGGLGTTDPIPEAWAKSTIWTRGDLPAIDDAALWASLPGLARAVVGGERVDQAPLEQEELDSLIDAGLPTIIWDTEAIDLNPPADLPGHRTVAVELLLGLLEHGSSPASGPLAILTLDREGGPSYLYRLDRSAVEVVAEAAGLARGPDSAP
jgi:hypothetical protein